MSQTPFHGSKGVRAIEVWLYVPSMMIVVAVNCEIQGETLLNATVNVEDANANADTKAYSDFKSGLKHKLSYIYTVCQSICILWGHC